jgi:hypothetical protein
MRPALDPELGEIHNYSQDGGENDEPCKADDGDRCGDLIGVDADSFLGQELHHSDRNREESSEDRYERHQGLSHSGPTSCQSNPPADRRGKGVELQLGVPRDWRADVRHAPSSPNRSHGWAPCCDGMRRRRAVQLAIAMREGTAGLVQGVANQVPMRRILPLLVTT